LAATLILVAAAGSILFIVSDGILGSHVIRWFTSFHLPMMKMKRNVSAADYFFPIREMYEFPSW
jgi:hypothetical protein